TTPHPAPPTRPSPNLHPPLYALAVLATLRIPLERRPAFLAEDEFDLAELMRLKAAARFQPVAERQEIERCDRLEHVDLRDQSLQNRENALERGGGERCVVVPQEPLEIIELVQDFLEPQLVDLMDDDKQRLVMLQLARPRLLQRQQFVELEITCVRDGHQAGLGLYVLSVA